MTASMTAFARKETHQSWGSLSWELRSVNQRYLEPSFRLPETLKDLEPALRNQLRQALSRGKLDVTLRFYPAETTDLPLNINQARLDQVIQAVEQVQSQLNRSGHLNPLQLLQWQGVIQTPELDEAELRQTALDLFSETLAELQAARLREGEALQALIEERLQQMTTQLGLAQADLPNTLAIWQNQLREKAARLGVEISPERLEQEIAVLAQKQDVAEELDRLAAHIKEVRRALGSKGPIGRRLDFLMQEMNREANTLGSKSISLALTQISVELKVLIEQMREQIQNLE